MSHLLPEQLLGINQQHLSEVPEHHGVLMHREVIAPLQQLMEGAREEGFNLRIASGFRSFDRQCHIWNQKCQGLRPVLDAQGEPLDIGSLTSTEKINAILHWSALPGASRHHWGTDCDIYDANAVDERYQLQLHPDEYTGQGPFTPMMQWLETWLARDNSPDFYRPYWQNPHSGVAPEPWHLSYRPLATQYSRQLSVEILSEHLQQCSEQALMEKQDLLNALDTIYHRYIQCDK